MTALITGDSEMEITTYLSTKKSLIDKALDGYLQAGPDLPSLLLEAMRYSVFAGGKRLRPILALAAGEAVGGNLESILPAACAIELIHTYSLIHDDLPTLDNDDYRRGKLTSHKVFGEDIALVAGDGLLTYAFELLSTAYGSGLVSPAVALRLIREVAVAAGIRGMVAGQVVDLQSEGEEPNVETLRYIHRHKTGDMITVSVRVGAIIAGASEVQLATLTECARNLGLAFQIIDDVLDVVGDRKRLGKTVGKDADQKKMTYVALYGLDEARKMVHKIVERAKAGLAGLNGNGRIDPLLSLADFVVNRDH
jgi:geranylgeranyl diphosphate synthase type II